MVETKREEAAEVKSEIISAEQQKSQRNRCTTPKNTPARGGGLPLELNDKQEPSQCPITTTVITIIS